MRACSHSLAADYGASMLALTCSRLRCEHVRIYTYIYIYMYPLARLPHLPSAIPPATSVLLYYMPSYLQYAIPSAIFHLESHLPSYHTGCCWEGLSHERSICNIRTHILYTNLHPICYPICHLESHLPSYHAGCYLEGLPQERSICNIVRVVLQRVALRS